MSDNTFHILRRVVGETKCKPGWSFNIVSEGASDHLTLLITIAGVDNYDHSRRFTVAHCHPVPITTYNEKRGVGGFLNSVCAA